MYAWRRSNKKQLWILPPRELGLVSFHSSSPLLRLIIIQTADGKWLCKSLIAFCKIQCSEPKRRSETDLTSQQQLPLINSVFGWSLKVCWACFPLLLSIPISISAQIACTRALRLATVWPTIVIEAHSMNSHVFTEQRTQRRRTSISFFHFIMCFNQVAFA